MTTTTKDKLSTIPWVVSCDTLRPEDLLPRFWSVAEQLGVELLPATLDSLQRLVGEDSSEADWSDTEASETLDELFSALDSAAPIGFGFGASEGDGACFGFWLGQEWIDALERVGLDCEDPEATAALIAELDAYGVTADNAEDAIQGIVEAVTESEAGRAYAQQLAEDTDAISRTDHWPLTCIDWDAAWRELEMGDGYSAISIGPKDWLIIRAV